MHEDKRVVKYIRHAEIDIQREKKKKKNAIVHISHNNVFSIQSRHKQQDTNNAIIRRIPLIIIKRTRGLHDPICRKFPIASQRWKTLRLIAFTFTKTDSTVRK